MCISVIYGKYDRACNDRENTLHKEQIEHLAAILHQPEQPKGKIRNHMEKMN